MPWQKNWDFWRIFNFLLKKVDFFQQEKSGEIWQNWQMVPKSSSNTLDGWEMNGEGVLDFETAKTDFINNFWSFLKFFWIFFQEMRILSTRSWIL